MPPLVSFEEALALGELRTRDEIMALVERAWAVRAGALRRLDRHVLAREREVRRLRRGLRVLRPVALRRGGHADARDDGAGADPRARARRRGGRRAPVLHGHPGPGAVAEGLREDRRGREARLRAHEPEAVRVGRAPVAGPRQRARRRRGAASASQRRDGALLLRRGDDHGPLRGPDANDRRGQGRGAGELRRRDPQPRRVAAPAGRDGVRAVGGEPDLGPDQPPQPAPRDEVRRPRADGPVGGRASGWRSSG